MLIFLLLEQVCNLLRNVLWSNLKRYGRGCKPRPAKDAPMPKIATLLEQVCNLLRNVLWSNLFSRSHAPRGNACSDAPRPASAKLPPDYHIIILVAGRSASGQAFRSEAWERDKVFTEVVNIRGTHKQQPLYCRNN
jgi:hypothetical protein